jgi:hypothetical protein
MFLKYDRKIFVLNLYHKCIQGYRNPQHFTQNHISLHLDFGSTINLGHFQRDFIHKIFMLSSSSSSGDDSSGEVSVDTSDATATRSGE